MTEQPRTDNRNFKNPHSLRNKLGRRLWDVCHVLLFRPTPPRLMGGWRTFMLRMFGAKLGKAWFHPSVKIWAPWLLEAGDDVFVDAQVRLYNAYGIKLSDRVIVSQHAFLCTASHDYTDPVFRLIGKAITVGPDAWVAADAFIAPGINVGAGAVVGARAVVVKDVAQWTIVAGNPARYIKDRVLRADAGAGL